MPVPQFALEQRAERLVLDLEVAIRTLREGIAAGGLTVPKQRWLLRELADAPHLVCELRGAMDAYRACAVTVRAPGAVLPLDLDARPLHVSDEEMR